MATEHTHAVVGLAAELIIAPGAAQDIDEKWRQRLS